MGGSHHLQGHDGRYIGQGVNPAVGGQGCFLGWSGQAYRAGNRVWGQASEVGCLAVARSSFHLPGPWALLLAPELFFLYLLLQVHRFHPSHDPSAHLGALPAAHTLTASGPASLALSLELPAAPTLFLKNPVGSLVLVRSLASSYRPNSPASSSSASVQVV